jgi:hypothetical protein
LFSLLALKLFASVSKVSRVHLFICSLFACVNDTANKFFSGFVDTGDKTGAANISLPPHENEK